MQIFARITSPATQSLTTYRPTPSTISFTVSTRPVPRTLPAHLLFYFSILVRIILGVIALALLWAKWHIKFPIEGGDVFKGARAELATWALGTVAGQAVTRVSTGLQWRWLIPGALGVLWGVCRRGYTGMSLSTSELN
jgi:phosphatidylinositol N-acetylglucosaminyltransferase subunit H